MLKIYCRDVIDLWFILAERIAKFRYIVIKCRLLVICLSIVCDASVL